MSARSTAADGMRAALRQWLTRINGVLVSD